MLGLRGVHYLRPLAKHTPTLWVERLVMKTKTTSTVSPQAELFQRGNRSQMWLDEKDVTTPAESESDWNTNRHFLWHTGSLCVCVCVCVCEAGRSHGAITSCGFSFTVYLQHHKWAEEKQNRAKWRVTSDACYFFLLLLLLFFWEHHWAPCIKLVHMWSIKMYLFK